MNLGDYPSRCILITKPSPLKRINLEIGYWKLKIEKSNKAIGCVTDLKGVILAQDMTTSLRQFQTKVSSIVCTYEAIWRSVGSLYSDAVDVVCVLG